MSLHSITSLPQAQKLMGELVSINTLKSGRRDATKAKLIIKKLAPRLTNFEKRYPGQAKWNGIGIPEVCDMTQGWAIQALQRVGKLHTFMSGKLGKTYASACKALGVRNTF